MGLQRKETNIESTELIMKKAMMKLWAKLMLDENMIDLSRYNAMVLKIDNLKE